jgi:HK97 family phage major capsid protein
MSDGQQINPVEVLTKSIAGIEKSLASNSEAISKMVEMQTSQAEIKKSKEESDAEIKKAVEEVEAKLTKSYNEKLQEHDLKFEEIEKSSRKQGVMTSQDITSPEVIEMQLTKSYFAELAKGTDGMTERLCADEEYVKKSQSILQNEIKKNVKSPYAFYAATLFESNLSKSIHNSFDSALGGLLANAPLILPIQRQLLAISPIRSLATVRVMNAKEAKLPIIDNYGSAKFSSIEATDYETDNTVALLKQKQVAAIECYFPFKVYQDFLREIANNPYGISFFNEILGVAAQQIQIKLNSAYINGDTVQGGGVIEGLIPEVAKTFQVSKSFDYQVDKIGFVKSGDANLITPDSLISLKRSLPNTLPNKVFVMNSETLAEVEKLKDTSGRYLFSYSTKEGFTNGMIEGILLGFPVVIDDTMPDIATNAFPIIFGNIAQSYSIIDAWNSNQELLTRVATGSGKVDTYIARLFSTGMRTGFQSYRLYKIAA